MFLALVALVGCGDEPETGEPSSSPEPPIERPAGEAPDTTAAAPASTVPTVDSTDWTAGRLSAPASGAAPPVPVLTDVRTGEHPGYERVVVDVDGEWPGYRLEYIDRPLHECGSGREVFPVGDAWLELRLEPAAAHSEAGEPTLGDREVAVDGPVIRRIYRTCDFEGVVTLVLAVSTPNAFRVVRLSEPTRIAVDVRR